jgi:hypothetical protein
MPPRYCCTSPSHIEPRPKFLLGDAAPVANTSGPDYPREARSNRTDRAAAASDFGSFLPDRPSSYCVGLPSVGDLPEPFWVP